jgi:hypothetical protein
VKARPIFTELVATKILTEGGPLGTIGPRHSVIQQTNMSQRRHLPVSYNRSCRQRRFPTHPPYDAEAPWSPARAAPALAGLFPSGLVKAWILGAVAWEKPRRVADSVAIPPWGEKQLQKIAALDDESVSQALPGRQRI